MLRRQTSGRVASETASAAAEKKEEKKVCGFSSTKNSDRYFSPLVVPTNGGGLAEEGKEGGWTPRDLSTALRAPRSVHSRMHENDI